MSTLRKDLDAAERMKTIRQSRHLTQDQLARAAGVSRSLVAQWETGRSGFAGKAVQIAKALEIPVRMLRPEPIADQVPGARARSLDQEQVLLRAFRELPADDQACVLFLTKRLARVD